MEIIEVLNNIGYTALQDCGNHYRTNPLYRSYRSQNTLAIKKTTGQWFDHSERIGGGLAQLIQKTLQLSSLDEAVKHMGDLPISVSVRDSVELTETKKFDKQILLKLVKDNSYWRARGINDYTLRPFEGGVAVTQGRMLGRYVFPIFDEKNDLIGFAGRLLQKNDLLPKWKIIGQKKNFIFPRTQKFKTIILVESIGDCLKLMECGVFNVMVSFGVSLSPKIIQHLLKMNVSKIVIALNNDEDGGFVGNEAAEEFKTELMNFFDESQIKIALPTGKDFGEMSCEDILKWKEIHLNEN